MTASTHGKEEELISKTHNTARFCVENPQITWVLLIGTIIWGIYGYTHMPQRKDPDVPPKQALVITPWPGASAEKIEQLVTRSVEKTVASNSNVSRIESVSRSHVSTVTFTLSNRLKETGQILDDIGGRLGAIGDLPQGAGPINYVRDFGDTATLLLTVASPKAGEAEIALRAQAIRNAIEAVRPKEAAGQLAIMYCFPPIVDKRVFVLGVTQFAEYARRRNTARNIQILDGPGFVGIDGEAAVDEKTALEALHAFLEERYGTMDAHPDAWEPFVVRDPSEVPAKLAAVVGEKYSYRELDNFTDSMEKALLATARTSDGPPLVAKVVRSGILPEKIYLLYSQQRLASYGIKSENLSDILRARNITLAGGQLDLKDKSVSIDPSGEFRNEREIGDVTVGISPYGSPLYLHDFVDTFRAYDSPPQYLSYYSSRDPQGRWQRTRAIVLSVQMGAGQQINRFAEGVD